MVAASARRHVLEVIHDIGRLEALVNEPNDAVKAALSDIVTTDRSYSVVQQRAAA
jgi:hypothetical protein